MISATILHNVIKFLGFVYGKDVVEFVAALNASNVEKAK